MPDLFEKGNQLSHLKKWPEAIAAYEQVLKSAPNHEWALNNLGYCLHASGQHGPAIDVLQRAVSLYPANARIHANLVAALEAGGWRFEAIPFRRRLTYLQPDVADYPFQLANSLLSIGRIREALFFYRRTFEADPHHRAAASNYLLALNYDDGATNAFIAQEHFRLARLWDAPPSLPKRKRGSEKIRLAYLSPDYCTHPVGKLIEPIFAAHDRDRFEVIALADNLHRDAVTEQISKHCTMIDVHDLSDEELWRRCLDLDLDILVELQGHTAGRNRLNTLARRVALVQIAFLGYPNTTGSTRIDYRITDAVCDPEGSQSLYSETLLYMPTTSVSYQPPLPLPPLTKPHRNNEPILFGSFNNPVKISEGMMAAWAEILRNVSGSRLLIKYGSAFSGAALKERWLSLFASNGIGAERLTFLPVSPDLNDHLQTLSQVDFALDPFPYQGTTTTLETLLMGVPIISQLGDTCRSRITSSILMLLGLDRYVAKNRADYIHLAIDLAQSGQRESPADIRNRFLASPICDIPQWTRDLETLYLSLAPTNGFTAEIAEHAEIKEKSSPRLFSAFSAYSAVNLEAKPKPELRLHIGGTTPREGWKILNAQPGPHVDYVQSCTNLSHFDDGSVLEIYASHILEHLGHARDLPLALAEMRRVLAPTGRLVGSVPDLAILSELLLDASLTEPEKEHVLHMMFGGQTDAFDYHKTGFTWPLLCRLLQQAGFQSFRRLDRIGLFRDCSDITFKGRLISINFEAS